MSEGAGKFNTIIRVVSSSHVFVSCRSYFSVSSKAPTSQGS